MLFHSTQGIKEAEWNGKAWPYKDKDNDNDEEYDDYRQQSFQEHSVEYFFCISEKIKVAWRHNVRRKLRGVTNLVSTG